MTNSHVLTAADILPAADYAKMRVETRRKVSERKKNRRIEVGPVSTFYFECRETMWLQVQEMLHIEKGGAEQLVDELAAYNPLIPNGSELIATFMIEIDDPERRKRVLNQIGGIEEKAFLQIGDRRIQGVPEADQDRTSAQGKASSVQFVHFPFTPTDIAAFRNPGERIVLGFDHANYAHMAIMPEAVRVELSGDFD